MCNQLVVKVYNGIWVIKDELYLSWQLSILQSCWWVWTLDFYSNNVCSIRKRDKIVVCDENNNVEFKWYVYDYEDCLEENRTKIKVNSEKWILNERFTTLSIEYNGDYKSLVDQIVNNLNTLYPEFTTSLSWAVNIDYKISPYDSLYSIFDSIASLANLDRDVQDWVIVFWSIWKNRDDTLYFDASRCDNMLSVCVSEGERASVVIWYNENTSYTATDFSQGNLGMVRYEFPYWNVQQQTISKLEELQGQNLIFKISWIQWDFDVCDTININIKW
jgi:hypothetical protein